MADYFVDFWNGNDGADGLSFPNRKKSLASAIAAASAGDNIKLKQTPDIQDTGVDITLTYQSISGTLASALTQTISNCESAWTSDDGLGVTTNTSSTRKEGSLSSSFAISGLLFSTGQAAHLNLGGTLDLSGYEQVSFALRPSANVAANSLTFRLCSDTDGLVTVDTLTIPYAMYTNKWFRFTVDTSGALGNAIQSIALDIDIDLGGSDVTILVDNIVACKASSANDCLTPNHIISIDQENWYSIRSIDDTTVVLDAGQNSAQGSGRGFAHDTATANLYAVLPLILQTQENASKTANADSYISIIGGYDSTDMSTLVGRTRIDFQNGSSGETSLTIGGRYNNVSNIDIVRGQVALRLSETFCTFTNMNIISPDEDTINFNAGSINWHIFDNVRVSATTGSLIGHKLFDWTSYKNCHSFSNGSHGFQRTTVGFNADVLTFTSLNNGGYGMDLQGSAIVTNGTIKGNGNFPINFNNTGGVRMYGVAVDNPGGVALNVAAGPPVPAGMDNLTFIFKNCTFNTASMIGNQTNLNANYVLSENHNGVQGDHRSWYVIGMIDTVADGNRDVATGVAYRVAITDTAFRQFRPVIMPITVGPFEADKQVDITVRVKRTSANIFCDLRVPAYALDGISSDIYVPAVSSGAYEDLSFSFTPTKPGHLLFQVRVWTETSTTDAVYVHRIIKAQA